MSDITRQKTIDYLYYLKTHYTKNLIIPEYIDFAISSLETDEAYQLEYESTTKNDLGVDCISRKAALGACHNFAIGVLDDYYEKCLKQWIIDLPSVTPIRPKGHWIGHEEHCKNLGVIPSGLGAYEWCSNCDCGIDVREWHRNHYNYCPNCGADMRDTKRKGESIEGNNESYNCENWIP